MITTNKWISANVSMPIDKGIHPNRAMPINNGVSADVYITTDKGLVLM